jgi:hypothetical protein
MPLFSQELSMVNNYEIQKAIHAAKLLSKAKPVVVIEPHIAVMPVAVAEAVEEVDAE